LSDTSKKLEILFKNLSQKDKDLALQNRLPYIFTKASYFIKDGPKLYSEKDALNMPDDSYSNDDIEKLKIGCKQIINGIGLTLDNPLKDLGIRGCHKLFSLFHFEMVDQKAFKNKNRNFVDEMTFKHIIDGKEVIYYNLVVI
tara:strand:+ start:1423 stop:1848 length:426 start_codon:yes stop_codon:yes gene_type:complete